MTIQSFRTTALFAGTVFVCLFAVPLRAQQPRTPEAGLQIDSDHDGLSDALEQQLLTQFMPRFVVGAHDCSVRPAEFKPELETPEVEADNGTIYGQAFPARDATDHAPVVEIHYYHLWRRDCGGHGHPLDTEHVSVLVRASETHLASATWKAVYWYAAAHEDTVCDVSQIARASTLAAEDHGATIWISPGKHASYLNDRLCERGCGADRCNSMVVLQPGALINLGEPGHPMNGSLFVSSRAWPLLAKMSASNFSSASVMRLNQLSSADIAWVSPGRHPAQGVIARSSLTEQAIAGGGQNTTTAISLAGHSTGGALAMAGGSTEQALSTTRDSTGAGLRKSYHRTRHALGASARHVGETLHITPEKAEEQPR